MTVNITLNASTAFNLSTINFGDILTHSIMIDLPAIPTANSTDLKIDLFAISSTTGNQYLSFKA